MKYKVQPMTQTRKKMTVLSTHLSIITLNIDGINYIIKRHRLIEWINKQNLSCFVYKKFILTLMVGTILKQNHGKKSIPGIWDKEARRHCHNHVWQINF